MKDLSLNLSHNKFGKLTNNLEILEMRMKGMSNIEFLNMDLSGIMLGKN